MGSSVTGTVWRPGEGLSTGRNVKPGESALESDSGVPTELKDPGSGLDVASNLITIKNYVYNRDEMPIRAIPTEGMALSFFIFILALSSTRKVSYMLVSCCGVYYIY
jgi:hypothetical protein